MRTRTTRSPAAWIAILGAVLGAASAVAAPTGGGDPAAVARPVDDGAKVEVGAPAGARAPSIPIELSPEPARPSPDELAGGFHGVVIFFGVVLFIAIAIAIALDVSHTHHFWHDCEACWHHHHGRPPPPPPPPASAPSGSELR